MCRKSNGEGYVGFNIFEELEDFEKPEGSEEFGVIDLSECPEEPDVEEEIDEEVQGELDWVICC